MGALQDKVAAQEDADKTVVSRIERQLDKCCLRFEDILRTKTCRGKTAAGKVKRTELSENR